MLIYDDFVCYWSLNLCFFYFFNWLCTTVDLTLQFIQEMYYVHNTIVKSNNISNFIMIVEPSPDLILALFATVNVFDKHHHSCQQKRVMSPINGNTDRHCGDFK